MADYEVSERYQLWHGDCLEEMDRIEDRSIDCILADLPYNVTNCHWDTLIPFEPLWKQYKRVIKKRGAVVLFGSQPFTTLLIASSPELGADKQWFKYTLVWDKDFPTDWQLANVKPLKTFEDLVILGNGAITYNPQMTPRDFPRDRRGESSRLSWKMNHKNFSSKESTSTRIFNDSYPKSVLKFNAQSAECNNTHRLHPTQKPVTLLSYLIKTYTNEGDLILDNCAGSGSTLEAAMRCNRRSIGIEKDAHYFNVAQQRLERVTAELRGELNHLPMFEGLT